MYEYMTSRELKERRRELEGYINSGYTFLRDDTIISYNRTAVDEFQEELDEINEELDNRIGRTLRRLAL